MPETSLLRPAITPYARNDEATGTVRWFGELELRDVAQVTRTVRTFRFVDPKGGEIPFRHVAGQYLTLEITRQGIPTRRSYTIASSPTWRDRIEITVKREENGAVSRWLHDEMRPGDRVQVEAPSGGFVFSGREWPTVVLIGGGVGITPMMSSVRYLTETDWPGTIYLLLSFKSPQDYIFKDEIETLRKRNPRLHVSVAMSAPGREAWKGHTGRIDARFVAAAVPDIALHRAHICGPTPMMDAVKAVLLDLGVPAGQIRTEAFGTDRRDPTGRTGQSGTVVGQVKFLDNGKTSTAREGATLLDVADEAKVRIDSACRSGTCGTCMVKLRSGTVRMPVQDALGDGDREDGYILACQAEPEGDVELEA